MKKGFTLIELLAVIVILAIIALIATPIVLNIIKDVKKSSNIRSAENYIHSLELSLANNQLTNSNLSDGFYSIDEIEVNVDGKKPTQGYVQIEKGNVVKYNVMIDNQEVDSIKNYKLWSEVNPIEITPIDNVYHINSAGELAWVAQVVNSGENSFENKIISLDANLDLNGTNKNWIAIGKKEYSFKGTFEGNNNVIKNIGINNVEKIQGLFGDVTNATIKDLVICDSSIKAWVAVGGFIGVSREYTKLLNLTLYNSIIIGENEESYSRSIGGIVGQYEGISDNLKVISGKIVSDRSSGGIFGISASNTDYTHELTNAYVDSNTTIYSQGYYEPDLKYDVSCCGGIIGFPKSMSINNSNFSGTIISNGSHNGGIAGQAIDTVITNSISQGTIEGTKIIGGLVAHLSQSTISDSSSYSIITTSTKEFIGGIIGDTWNCTENAIVRTSSKSTINGVLVEENK